MSERSVVRNATCAFLIAAVGAACAATTPQAESAAPEPSGSGPPVSSAEAIAPPPLDCDEDAGACRESTCSNADERSVLAADAGEHARAAELFERGRRALEAGCFEPAISR